MKTTISKLLEELHGLLNERRTSDNKDVVKVVKESIKTVKRSSRVKKFLNAEMQRKEAVELIVRIMIPDIRDRWLANAIDSMCRMQANTLIADWAADVDVCIDMAACLVPA